MAVMEREERPAWTDRRLDDLKGSVDGGFGDMREEFRATRGEMSANHRALMQMAAGIWITAVVGFLGVIATVITQA
ncbi:MAG TPA: hypothetical protein VLL27_13780 [Solirubrobacterales bacterium]|nr:hypothetical protein [Solirubrobacterales bacterium]